MLDKLLPPAKTPSFYDSRPDQSGLVPLDRWLRRSPRGLELRKTLHELDERWPNPAMAIRDVRSARWGVTAQQVARARTNTWKHVDGYVEFSRVALQDPLLDIRLLGLQDSGETVGGSLADVLVHEWGHLTVGIPILCRYPDNFETGLKELIELVERRCGENAEETALKLSYRATYSREEFLAEAFTDCHLNGEAAEPFSQELGRLLHELWPKMARWFL